ncbi:MAG TPA: LLM class flavin-dependent oxidoreductase [Steroidobacteraceae bacterium]|nr:LLM class flavin-dependent oxidoreductase [Steroidobacteraceae bacterium]
MNFGIALPTPADSWKTVKRAEDAGFSAAWFYDTPLLSADIFVAMGAAAVKTDRIRLGTGVLIPSNRIAPVAANGLATLNALAPGRIDAGFGTGYTGRRSMGLGPHKLSDMDEYIRVVTAMLRGEKPQLHIESKTRKVGFLNPETKLINIDEQIPAYVSALGPKARRMTADVDAHWININFTEEFSAITARKMEAEYRAVGRDPAGKRKIIFFFGSVLKEGEDYDSPRVKAEVGPAAMMMLHNAMEQQNYGSLIGEFESSIPPNPALDQIVREYRTVYESYTPVDARYLTLHKGHLMFVRPEEDRFATGDLIRAMTVSGNAPELRDRMRRLREAGYDEVVVQITPGCESMIEDWARVFESI